MNEMRKSLFSLIDIAVSINNLNKKTERNLGLSLVQWCVLARLVDMPAASAYSLAEAAGVHPSTLSETLPRLQRKGYVFITEDPKDSRKKMISITRIGNEALEIANRRLDLWLKGIKERESDFRRIQYYLNSVAGEEVANEEMA